MKISPEQKQQIQTCIVDDLRRRRAIDSSYSQTQHAKYLDVNISQYSRVVKGEVDRVLSDIEWIRVGRRLYVDISGVGWKIVDTYVFKYIHGQLEAAQQSKLSIMNMDIVGIGKTTTALQYAQTHPNVIYIKGRIGISRKEFIKLFAQQMGLSSYDKTEQVRARVEMHLVGMKNPLIIIDDAGYLSDQCWMEIKGLYDAVEFECGWYVIGDTSLGKKIKKLVANDALGWAALFSRFTDKFQSISNSLDGEAEVMMVRRNDAYEILKANMPHLTGDEQKAMLKSVGLSLRVLRKEINKMNGIKDLAA